MLDYNGQSRGLLGEVTQNKLSDGQEVRSGFKGVFDSLKECVAYDVADKGCRRARIVVSSLVVSQGVQVSFV